MLFAGSLQVWGCSDVAHQSGQAAVESALTLPMMVFLVLGTMQLFMLLQAKAMAQYAVFQAARVGSVTNGRCDVMTHAAVLALIPTIRSFLGPTSAGTPGEKLGHRSARCGTTTSASTAGR